jgi:hypothetical protein
MGVSLLDMVSFVNSSRFLILNQNIVNNVVLEFIKKIVGYGNL